MNKLALIKVLATTAIMFVVTTVVLTPITLI